MPGCAAADACCNAPVRTWHRAEVFGAAAIPSGYRGTYPVHASLLACVFMTLIGLSACRNRCNAASPDRENLLANVRRRPRSKGQHPVPRLIRQEPRQGRKPQPASHPPPLQRKRHECRSQLRRAHSVSRHAWNRRRFSLSSDQRGWRYVAH